jgi:hypothetical protein
MPNFHDAPECEALRAVLRPGAVFLDIGANAGFYTFWALSQKHADLRVIAVEEPPDPDRKQDGKHASLETKRAEGAADVGIHGSRILTVSHPERQASVASATRFAERYALLGMIRKRRNLHACPVGWQPFQG